MYGFNLFLFSADFLSVNENLYFQKITIRYIPNSNLFKWYQSKNRIFKKLYKIMLEKIGDSGIDTSKIYLLIFWIKFKFI